LASQCEMVMLAVCDADGVAAGCYNLT
jgi:hypothetical protein